MNSEEFEKVVITRSDFPGKNLFTVDQVGSTTVVKVSERHRFFAEFMSDADLKINSKEFNEFLIKTIVLAKGDCYYIDDEVESFLEAWCARLESHSKEILCASSFRQLPKPKGWARRLLNLFHNTKGE